MPKATRKSPQSRDDAALRRVETRMKLRALRFAEKQQKAFLATHAAADRGRRNSDWKASANSADAAIIPDSPLLNARARQFVRDSWVGKSAVRAFSRNVIGCGILPIPIAKDKKGKLLVDFNKKSLQLFWAWAKKAKFCDVEGRQTFWQKQNLTVEERATVGEHMIVWSYEPDVDARGRVKPGSAVGLKLQSFESEQFDLRLQSYTDPATGRANQVRGGVEVDDRGRPVAYHFYTRNPADYLPVGWRSVRIPAARVVHYFKQERVLQCRGVTPLACVLQDGRDLNRYRDATLWRAIMEACIGMVIKKMPAANSPFGVAPAPGDSGQTPSGMRTIDFVPGMVPELLPGEEIQPYIPSSPGNQYEPYVEQTLRGIGAGIGLSGSQLLRRSESNYSAARQDMLEDRKEFEPEQELFAHNVLFPIYELFVRFAYMEGRLDDVLEGEAGGESFLADAERYIECEYVAPAAPWIDPEKEANAYEKLLKLKVMDRDEVISLRGRRRQDVWDKIEEEQEEADDRGISLPEEAENTKLEFQRDIVKTLAENPNSAAIIANKLDLGTLVDDAGLPENDKYDEPYLPVTAPQGQLVNGKTIEDDEGDVVGGDVKPPPKPPTPPSSPFPQNGGKTDENSQKTGENGEKQPPPEPKPASLSDTRIAQLYSDDQPRDSDGKFASGGGGESSGSAKTESPDTQTATAEQPWHETVPQTQREAVRAYVGDAYKTIRSYQEGRLAENDPRYAEAKAHAEQISSMMASAPKSQATVYRGLHDLSERMADKLSNPGTEFTANSFQSATASKKVAESFSKTFDKGRVSMVLKIKNATGVDISDLSGVKVGGRDEREMLLDKGSRFKVVDRTIRSGGTNKYRYDVTLEQI